MTGRDRGPGSGFRRSDGRGSAGGRPVAARLVAVLAIVVAALGSALASCTRAPRAEHRPPNLLLVTVDTLRADHLGFAGYPRDTSPSLDALARAGTWFPAVYSQSATTGTAHASLFTSLPPREHGVTANSRPFPSDPAPATLMGALADHGYFTAAFVSSIVVGRRSGLQKHFDHFDDELTTEELNRKARYERPADQTVAAALALLEQRPADEPFFLWIHLIDPHGPYAAPRDPDRYVGDAFSGKTKKPIPLGATDWEPESIPRYQILDGRTDADYYVARYDAEIRYADAALGRLFEELKRRGLFERTLIAVTADHGETLAEARRRRYFTHGVLVYDETVRIPLVVHEPEGQRRLDAVDRRRMISSLDIAPTLLALLDVPAPASFVGRNLLRGEADPEALVYSLGQYGSGRLEKRIGTQFGVRRGALTYIVNSKDGSEELYDRERDPGETRNLLAAGTPAGDASSGRTPADIDALRAGVAAQVEGRENAIPAPELSEEQKAGLRALGYAE